MGGHPTHAPTPKALTWSLNSTSSHLARSRLSPPAFFFESLLILLAYSRASFCDITRGVLYASGGLRELTKAAAAHRCLVSNLRRPRFLTLPRHVDSSVCNESTQAKFPGLKGKPMRDTKCVHVLRRLLRNQVMFSWIYNATPDAPMSYPMPALHCTPCLSVCFLPSSYSLL
ncbi:hypothetical protein CGRA01v4_06074 [Colletotrichum graminicola]|nr:hypothetical protein CGRA01v4_06074 [Colletotrichum graminicola]